MLQRDLTDTMPSFVLRTPDGKDAGTLMGAQISRAGYTELTGATHKRITVTVPTKITASGFGYNENRSNFGTAGAPAGAKAQFTVAADVTTVRVA